MPKQWPASSHWPRTKCHPARHGAGRGLGREPAGERAERSAAPPASPAAAQPVRPPLGAARCRPAPALVGGTGTGKTHLAIAIARSCIRDAARARFYNVVDLVNRLEAEARAGRQGRIADHLAHLDLVVLDELGYLPFAQSCRGGGILSRRGSDQRWSSRCVAIGGRGRRRIRPVLARSVEHRDAVRSGGVENEACRTGTRGRHGHAARRTLRAVRRRRSAPLAGRSPAAKRFQRSRVRGWNSTSR